jgi:hypothetical protein
MFVRARGDLGAHASGEAAGTGKARDLGLSTKYSRASLLWLCLALILCQSDQLTY